MNAKVFNLPGLNGDDFSPDDVAARADALDGTPRPYDELIMNIRRAYRAGQNGHQQMYGDAGRTTPAELHQLLIEVFPTSAIHCGSDPQIVHSILIAVRFPEA